ncbi:hypothetical protein AN958_10152 [Leucoagaricus sp. SymC.cos]|nr:hypothetical protein AN958_10152 [Leucoagaricus sp. SymC.cos]
MKVDNTCVSLRHLLHLLNYFTFNSLGAAFIGVICAAMLYGVSCVQTLYYFTRYPKLIQPLLTSPKDVWYIKGLVALVWTFDTIHQCLICHTVYYYVISNFNNPMILTRMVCSVCCSILFKGLVGFLVQGFLTLRVWRLSSNNVYITTTIVSLAHPHFSPCCTYAIGSIQYHDWEELKALKGLSITVNILAVLPDVLIASSLFYFLHRSRTGFRKSDTMITRLVRLYLFCRREKCLPKVKIVFTVSTGVFTSICAVASLVSILAWGDTLIYVAFYFSLGKLYSNSVLATLNARITIRGLGEDSDELSFSLQTVTKSGQPTFNTSTILRPTNISIKIDTTQELSRDHNIQGLEVSSLPSVKIPSRSTRSLP